MRRPRLATVSIIAIGVAVAAGMTRAQSTPPSEMSAKRASSRFKTSSVQRHDRHHAEKIC
jgi:hypothetical protein